MKTYIGKDIQHIVDYCKTNMQEDIALNLKVAEDVLRHTFLFESKWELERTYEPVTFEDGHIVWDHIPAGDPEWVYAMNRHHCFITLAQAYALTQDEKYTAQFIHLLTHWIEYSPLTEASKQTTWRTIETGLRCENWVKAYEIFSMSPLWNENLEKCLRESLDQQAQHILAHSDDFRHLSNWGVIENHGLFVAGVFLGNATYISVAKERLESAINLQVLADGVHREQSQLYHNEVLRAFIDVGICAKNNNIVFSENFHKRVMKMVEAHIYMTKPNHYQLSNGDSDDMDLRDILVRAAYLYKDMAFKALGYSQVDFESIWDIGMEGVAVYDALKGEYPAERSKALSASGNYCMRESWDEDSLYVHFKCGNLGGGHGHVDLLHVDISYLGEDVITDQGRYTYTNTKERFQLKNAKAHNTVVIDDTEFTQITDTWGYSKVAPHVQRDFVTHAEYDYVEGAHLGYMDLDSSVFVNRKVIVIKPNIVVLVDEFITKGTHKYQQYFHFGEGSLEIGEQVIFKGEKVQATFHQLQPNLREKLEMQTSKTYNHIQKQEVLRTTTKQEGSTMITTVIVLEDKAGISAHKVESVPIYTEGQRLQGDEHVEAFKITYGNTAYTLVVKHDEAYRHLMVVEGRDVYGRVALIKEQDGQQKIHTMIW
ncbi:MAG: alginate lyase family protein [Niameybacter sp.]